MRGKKQKILVAMSGGVDSSVAAALLLTEGYDVTGAYMVNYDTDTPVVDPPAGGSLRGVERIYADTLNNKKIGGCWHDDYLDATRVAAKLGIPLIKLDFTKEYSEFVLKYMYEEYAKGRTPNPDVLCNKFIKFGVWLKKARELGFDKLATGHYARLRREIRNPCPPIACAQGAGRRAKSEIRNKFEYHLMEAKDKDKDQTYFLHQLTQAQLKHILFPLGNYTKKQVRVLARKYKLPNAERAESMGICFVGEVPMKEFLLKKIKKNKGDIILSSGEKIGEHDGLAFYTIGQRHLKIKPSTTRVRGKNAEFSPEPEHTSSTAPRRRTDSLRGREHTTGQGVRYGVKIKNFGCDSKPLYVVDKNIETNELVLGNENDELLYKKESEVIDINWISGQIIKFPLKCKVRLRHRQPLQDVQLLEKDGKIVMNFNNKQKAVTPGQFAVFYKGGVCLGGGVVK